MKTFEVRSPSWPTGGAIPLAHTCDGANTSPALEWSAGPPGTLCYALICDDPDAPLGTWTHWAVWNIPSTSIGEAVPPVAELSDGSVQGKNSWSRTGYGGPCPPEGTHHYHFRLYALDARLSLAPGSDSRRLREAMDGHVLAEGSLVGTYSRERAKDAGAAQA